MIYSLQTWCCMGGISLWLVAALFACWAGYSTRGPGWSVGHHLDLHTCLVSVYSAPSIHNVCRPSCSAEGSKARGWRERPLTRFAYCLALKQSQWWFALEMLGPVLLINIWFDMVLLGQFYSFDSFCKHLPFIKARHCTHNRAGWRLQGKTWWWRIHERCSQHRPRIPRDDPTFVFPKINRAFLVHVLIGTFWLRV